MAGTHGNRTIRALLENANFEALRSLDILDLAGINSSDSKSLSVSTTLSEEAKKAITNALSPRTWRAYVSAIEKYVMWCNRHSICPFPTTPVAVCNYLSSLATSGKRHGTLRVVVCAIAYIHRLQEIPSPTNSQLVRSALRGIRREDGRPVRQAEPMTPEIMEAIRAVACEPRKGPFGHIESRSFALYRGLVDIALISTLFYAGLRRSEVADLRWNDVERQTDSSGLIFIHRSKKRYPDDVQVVAIPEGAVSDLDAIRPRYSAGHKRVFGLSPGQLDNRIKSAVKQAGIDGSFSAHSGRVGMAKYLKEKRAPDHIIRRQGRWKDNRMVDRYTRRARASVVLSYFDSGPTGQRLLSKNSSRRRQSH